jgi:hypothetical protein
VRTSNEDADTGWTTAGSVVITTKSGTNEWHGDAAFYERAAAAQCALSRLRIRRKLAPTELVCTIPSSPSRARITWPRSVGPSRRTKCGSLLRFEHVHENASIAYSPASVTQFDALAQLAADGLIAGVPCDLPFPQRCHPVSAITSARCVSIGLNLRSRSGSCALHKTATSRTMHWWQQATLPSTGLTTHNNYWNTCSAIPMHSARHGSAIW